MVEEPTRPRESVHRESHAESSARRNGSESLEEIEKILRDNRALQTELELRTEELRLTQGELEIARERSTRMYDDCMRAEAALSFTEERLRLTLEAANTGTWEWNTQTNENRWSANLWRMYGLAPDSCEASYNAWLQSVHPDDRDRVQRAVLESAAAGTEINAEWRVFSTAGEVRWLTSRGNIIRDDNGTATRYLGVVFDVTERKLTESRIGAAQIEMQALLAESERSRRAMLSVVEDQMESGRQIRVLNDELEQRVQDRTAQLTAANRELEAFSYSVSHDLRAPLRAMDGFSGALLADYEERLDEQGRHYLLRIKDASRRMAQLIDDLLGLSQVTRCEMNLEPVDLSAIAQQIAEDLHSQSPERQVEFDIAPGLVARADRNLMRIVLQNLLGNAYKFTSKCEQAQIRVGEREQSGSRVFFVSDNGAGFKMEYRDKLFAPFQRLHSTREFPGNGIGLATVQRIIARHGCQLWAEAAVNRGATFFFTLEA
jgi:PAS domain S-box-containing protein